ncbi:sterol desaturase family protein [Dyella sp. 20L07]|uniref:sterol desaturase family protein n=1 Tax=Dyella sp. 20L07 TaxID=3384240 RepID=UPI003D2A3288
MAGDLIAYFRHRFEHSRLLWPSHVMHHSDTDMNWTTVYRFHPINRLSTVLIDFGGLAILGFPPYVIAINAVFRSYYGVFVHANLPWTLGWLGKIFVSPAMHRWHHVLEGEGVGSNFASVFSFIDRAFGTYYVPGPCDRPLGVPGVVDGDAFGGQLVLPIQSAKSFLSRTLRR